MQILVLNGVNLDMLAHRDPRLYGGLSLNELETRIYEWAHELTLTVRCRQSNSEGEYIGWIHDAYGESGGVIVNPGAWTHYSYALRDALEIVTAPKVEVHLSDIEAREDFRRFSVIAELATHRVMGKGPDGYREGLELLAASAGTRLLRARRLPLPTVADPWLLLFGAGTLVGLLVAASGMVAGSLAPQVLSTGREKPAAGPL